jgi:hypothetical protein
VQGAGLGPTAALLSDLRGWSQARCMLEQLRRRCTRASCAGERGAVLDHNRDALVGSRSRKCEMPSPFLRIRSDLRQPRVDLTASARLQQLVCSRGHERMAEPYCSVLHGDHSRPDGGVEHALVCFRRVEHGGDCGT